MARVDPETITEIRAPSGHPLRRSVVVGPKCVARLSPEAVERLGLRAGAAWDAEAEQRVRDAGSQDNAMRYAVRLLRKRPLGSGEMLERLRRRGFDAAAAEWVVRRLTEQRILDDAAYGRLVVESELARKPAGRGLLVRKLARKRLGRDLIAQVVQEAVRRSDPIVDARHLVEQKLRNPSMRRCPAVIRKQRLWGLLARRGFDQEVIEAVLGDGLASESNC